MNHDIENLYHDMNALTTKIAELTADRLAVERKLIQQIVDQGWTHCLTIKRGPLHRMFRKG